MKKTLFVFIFLFFNLILLGEEVTLDALLEKIDETSYRRKMYELEQEKNNNSEKFYETDKYNGIKSSVTTEYNDTEKIYKTTGRAEFGDLYIEGKEIPNDKEEDTLIFGINKNIKDMIFSQNDSNLLKNDLKREADKYTFLKNMEEQKIALINLYRDYKTTEFEIKIKKNGLKTLKSEEKTLEKSFELGAIPRIELESLQYSRKNLEIEIETLEENLKNIKTRFLHDFKIDISDKTLANITPNYTEIKDYISTTGYKDIEKLRIEKDIIKENIRYLNYNDKMPELSLGLERDTKINENRLVFKISKPLFYFNADLENEKISYTQQEILLNQKIEENAAEKIKLKSNYTNYIKEYRVLKNKAELEKNKYEIKKLEYSLGKINYLEVMESFDDYMEYEVSQEKAKNILNSYVYEIMVKGE